MEAATKPTPLLRSHEPGPVASHRLEGSGRFVLTCDHAAYRVPDQLRESAPAHDDLTRHIGWDPGAYALAQRLSARLDAPLLAQRYSRLVIDCNRRPGVLASTPEVSDGTVIPFNQELDDLSRALREREILQPYHDAISGLLDARLERPHILVPIHSFTPRLGSQERPWHVSLMCDDDRRVHDLLLAWLQDHHPRLVVGDNEPYRVEPVDYTVPVHGTERGLPCTMIEVRQDLLATPRAQERWCGILAAGLEACARRLFGHG